MMDVDARSTTVSPSEAAQRIGLRPGTLANMRWRGDGPRYIKVGGRVRYRLVDLAVWLEDQIRESTSDGGGDPR